MLDRVEKEKETHPGLKRHIDFTYVGLSDQVATEAHDDPSSATPTARDVTKSYGYDAYGGADPQLTTGDNDPLLQLNAYRYTGKRTDVGSATIDMGARRFATDASRFLQPDVYQGALANLGLSMDPLTGNRYALAAGNPVSFVEVDGHRLADLGPAKAPDGPPTGDPRLPDVGNSAPADRESTDSVLASIGTGLRDVAGGAKETGEDVLGVGKGVVVGTVEAVKTVGAAAVSCASDFSGCRGNVGAFGSAVWDDPFGVASGIAEATVDEAMTKIRQGHPGEAIGGLIGLGKLKPISKLDEATRGVGAAADDLARAVGRSRVTIKTPTGRYHVDLRGKSHFEKSIGESVASPHVRFDELHVNPHNPGLFSYVPGAVRSATWSDLRIVKQYLQRYGEL